jgi:hypothetical protein
VEGWRLIADKEGERTYLKARFEKAREGKAVVENREEVRSYEHAINYISDLLPMQMSYESYLLDSFKFTFEQKLTSKSCSGL